MDKQKLQRKAFAASAQVASAVTRLRKKPLLATAGRGLQRFILCALLARGTMLEGFSPFAVAMTGAYCALGGGFSAVLGSFFGYLVIRGDFIGVSGAAASLLVMACAHVCSDFKVFRTVWFMPLITMLCMAGCSFVFLPALSVRTVMLFICALILTFGACYFYRIALSPPKNAADIMRPGGLLVLTATILVSVYDITVWGMVSPARVIALALVMGATYTSGSAGGAALGVAFGITMDAAMGQGALFTCTYSFGALIGGVFRGAGKIGFAVTYLCAAVAASLLGTGSQGFIMIMAECAGAAAIFVLIPDGVWQYARESLLPAQKDTADTVQRVRQNARRYASETSQVFYEMYLSMMSGAQHGKNAGEEDIRVVFDRAADRVCRRCTLCAGCWERDYVGTLSALNDVSIAMVRRGRAEAADFPRHFASRCLKFPEFVRAVNEALSALRQRQMYQAQCEENRSLVAQQYAGLTGILRQVGMGLSQDVTTLPARERQVRRYAQAFAKIDRVAVYRDGNNRLRIEIGGEEQEKILAQKKGFTAGLAALLSVGLTEPETICDELGSRLLLREQAPYRAVVGVGQRKKAGESVSGDSGRYFVTDSGRACIILSDGMGSGENAAHDSQTVLGLMERFLNAGISAQDALRTVSPAFRLRSEGKRFVTMDVLCVDLFTGNAESLKCGAAPSYLKTGGGIVRLASTSLPIGLADDGAPEDTVPLRMGHGDLYIMLTDGVTDGIEDGWLQTLIGQHAGDSPKELAARLVVAAGERGASDDMMAFVMRIEKTR